MARKNYHIDEVLKSLDKKRDVRIDPIERIVRVLRNSSQQITHDLGNGSWGKIDFLVNHCGFVKFYVDKF